MIRYIFLQNDNLFLSLLTFACLCFNRQVPTFAETLNAKVYETITHRRKDDDFDRFRLIR